MVLYGTIDSLIDFFSFTAWIFYGGAMLALIVMRYTKPTYPRPYKVRETAMIICSSLIKGSKVLICSLFIDVTWVREGIVLKICGGG